MNTPHPSGTIPKADCALGLCDHCSIGGLSFCPQEEEGGLPDVTFMQFAKVQRGKLSIVEPESVTLPVGGFIKLFKERATAYVEHYFAANWQTMQKSNLVEHLPPDERLVYIDFAANHVHQCYFEIQAQEFAKFQSSILVIMVGERPDTQSKTRFHTHFFCSDDREHDFFYITNALKKLMPLLGTAVRRVHFFSDGAPTQFKNKYLMNWISEFDQSFGAQCIWNFFATSHGRGPWDAEGGRLKIKMSARWLCCVTQSTRK
jgi:hypothetical protein